MIIRLLNKINLKRCFHALVSALMLAGFISLCAVLYESWLYNGVGSSVVMLTKTASKRSGGTGFQIVAPSGRRYILTNKHVCEIDKRSLLAHSQDGRTQEVRIIKKYKHHDLCLMESFENLPALDIASSIDLHERTWLIGHPALRPLSLESGHYAGSTFVNLFVKCSKSEINLAMNKLNSKKKVGIQDLFELLLLAQGYCQKRFKSQYITNISYGGNSGSPVVNKFGNVIGVLFAGRPDQPTASYTVPLYHIHEFLKGK